MELNSIQASLRQCKNAESASIAHKIAIEAPKNTGYVIISEIPPMIGFVIPSEIPSIWSKKTSAN